MKRKSTTQKKASCERIWWLLEHDLEAWASVMVGYQNGTYKIWAHYQNWRAGTYRTPPIMCVLGLQSDEKVFIDVEKISEAELIAWWRGVVDRENCVWDESDARARYTHLTLLEPEIELLRLRVVEMGRQMGRAAPLWVRFATHNHVCAACRAEDEEMGRSSTLEQLVDAELEQAKARVRKLESLLDKSRGSDLHGKT
jgi:hypothetical protein